MTTKLIPALAVGLGLLMSGCEVHQVTSAAVIKDQVYVTVAEAKGSAQSIYVAKCTANENGDLQCKKVTVEE